MDFSALDQPHREFSSHVDDFLDRHLTLALQQRLRRSRDEHDPEFFRALGSRGWVMPSWAKERGGAGLTPLEARILQNRLILRDAPRLCVATTRMVAPVLVRYAHEGLQAQVLPEITTGRSAIALGYTEAESGSDVASAKLSARREGDAWILNGTKLFTTGAHTCQYTFLLTRTARDQKHRGLTMFLVPTDIAGIEVAEQSTLGERTNTVTYEDAVVPDYYRVGDVDQGWRVLVAQLEIEHGRAGGNQRADEDPATLFSSQLWLTVRAAADHVRTSSLGAHATQRSARLIAEACLDIEIAMSLWSEGGRIVAAERLISRSAALAAMVGEPSPSDDEFSPAVEVNYWHDHSQVSSIYGGSVEIYRNMIAENLGLPRPQYGETA